MTAQVSLGRFLMVWLTLPTHFDTTDLRRNHIARGAEGDFDGAAVQDNAEDDGTDVRLVLGRFRAEDGHNEQAGDHEKGSDNHDRSSTDPIVQQ